MTDILVLLHARLLQKIEEAYNMGKIDKLQKLDFLQKISRCFKEREELWVLNNVNDLLKKSPHLNELSDEFLSYWTQIKINQAYS